MGELGFWFKGDVANILAGIYTQAHRQPGSDYQQGYLDALGDIATSFGLDPAILTAETTEHTTTLIVYQQE